MDFRLIDNQVDFLSGHRGDVFRVRDSFEIRSSQRECCYTIIGKERLEEDYWTECPRVLVSPESFLKDSELIERGFIPKYGLAYMSAHIGIAENWPVEESNVKTVQCQEDMDLWSSVQCHGFLETPAAYQEWASFMTEANNRNLDNINQKFYMAYNEGKPASVVLTVRTGTLCGIYAVTTLPAFRKQGLSTKVLKKAVNEAKNNGCLEIALQVTEGSYAESFYRKLGFKTAFISKMFVRGAGD